jgi:hypothetical protein
MGRRSCTKSRCSYCEKPTDTTKTAAKPVAAKIKNLICKSVKIVQDF